MAEAKRVVVTGAKGEVGDAIVRRLRAERFVVDALERGDDVVQRIRRFRVDRTEDDDDLPPADAIVVLDAISGNDVDYRRALEAVAEGVVDSRATRIVSVTPLPPDKKERERRIGVYKETEERLSSAGLTPTAIRYGVLVGSLANEGPLDSVLFRKHPLMPGTGQQKIRPLVIDDLAALVAVAVTSGASPVTIEVEGPQECTLEDLLRTLNPGVKPKRRRYSRPWTVVAIVLMVAGLVGQIDFRSGTFLQVLSFGLLTLGWLLFLWLMVKDTNLGVLPRDDLLLNATPVPRPLDVGTHRVEEVWTAAAIHDRAQRPSWKKSARKYASTQGSTWTAVLLLVAGLGALAVGLHDAAAALSGLGVRLAGLLLAISGLAMLIGATALFRQWPSRYEFGFLGSAVCTAMFAVLIISAVVGGDAPGWTLLLGYAAVLPVLASAHLWRWGGLALTRLMATRGEKIVGSVLLGGTVATLVQVLYSSVYVPATANPSVSAESKLVASGTMAPPSGGAKADRRVMLTASVDLSNPSDQPVTILGAPYVVIARHLRAFDGTKADAKTEQLGGGSRRRERAEQDEALVVEDGNVVEPGMVLEGGEKTTRQFVVFAPTGYTVASFRVDLAVARQRYKREDGLITQRFGNPKRITVTSAHISDPSWLHRITRSRRYVHVASSAGGDLGCKGTSRVIAAYIDGSSDSTRFRPCSDQSRIDQHYGIAYKHVMVETRMPPRPAP